MFKNLKERVASEKKVRTPQSDVRNEAPNTTPSSRSTKLPRPSRSLQPRRLPMDKDGTTPVKGVDPVNEKAVRNTGDLHLNETGESTDSVQSTGTSGEPVGKNGDSGAAPVRSDQNHSESASGDKKSSFFKRLEFLSPLKDQVARGLSESKESISSLVDEMRGNMSNASNENLKPNERTRLDSVSDTEDLTVQQHNIDLSSIPKEQLLAKVMRLERTLHKYREKYSELSSNLREAKQEREKLHSVMQQTQDKSFRRIQELKEQAALDLKAKMHLEEEFRVSLEEKDQLIQVQQTQIAILKNSSSDSKEIENHQVNSDSTGLEKKVKKLEEQLKFARETCEGFKSQSDALQSQLDERLAEVNSLNQSNLSEKSKLIKQLREAKNVIEQLEEDKQTAVAEAKRQMHEILEGKDQELMSLQEQLKDLNHDFNGFKAQSESKEASLAEELQNAMAAQKTAESECTEAVDKVKQLDERLDDRLNKMENDFDGERKQFVSEISHLKAEALKLSENLEVLQRKHETDLQAQVKMREVALESQAKKFKTQMLEKENQMRLAIEERELNKMAAVSQQDTEAQNLLKELDGELETVRKKVEVLERTKLEDEQRAQNEISKLQEDIEKNDALYEAKFDNLNKSHEEFLSKKSQEFSEQFAQQKLDYDERLETVQSEWAVKLKAAEDKFADEKQKLKVKYEESEQGKKEALHQQGERVMFLESQLSAFDVERAELNDKIAELEARCCNKDMENDEIKTAQEKVHAEALLKLQQLEQNIADKDLKISALDEKYCAAQKEFSEKEMISKKELDETALERHYLQEDIKTKDTKIATLSKEIEELKKEFAVKEQDILQKSANSDTELQNLFQSVAELRSEKSEVANQLKITQEKSKEKEEKMKNYMLEMEAKHNDAMSKLSLEMETKTQDAVVKIAEQEKAKMELQMTVDETHKKFVEAGSRLKALAQKYKATVAEHGAIVKKKDNELSLELEKSKSLEERISQLQITIQEITTENESKIKQIKTDFERERAAAIATMDEKFLQEKNDIKTAHQKQLEDVERTLSIKFTEEKDALEKELACKFESSKKQLLDDAMEKFEIEKEALKVKLQSLSSDASEKEKSLMTSFEDVTKQLHDSVEDKQKLQESVRLSTEKISELENMIVIKENLAAHLTQKNEILNSENEVCRQQLDASQNALTLKSEELENLQKSLEQMSEERKNIEGDKNTFEEKFLQKQVELSKICSSVESKDAELKELKATLDQQFCKTEESTSRISQLETQIEKFELLLTEESNKFKSTSDSHASAIEKLNSDWQGKYSELKAKAEQKISQLQQHLKSAKSELTSQCDVIQKLGKEKSEGENELKLLIDRVALLEKREKDFEDLQNKSSVIEKELTAFKNASDDLKSQMASTERMKDTQIEDLQKELETQKSCSLKSQNVVENLKIKLEEAEKNHESLLLAAKEGDSKLKLCSAELDQSKKELESMQVMLEKSNDVVEKKNIEVQNLAEKLSLSEKRVEELLKDYEIVKSNEQEKSSSLQLALVQNDEIAESLRKVQNEHEEKEKSLINEINTLKKDFEKTLAGTTERLEEDGDKKLMDLKKKAEVRLAQIKKSFTVQLEEKLKVISKLEEEKKALEEKAGELSSNNEHAIAEKDSECQRILQENLQTITALEERNKSLEDRVGEMSSKYELLVSEKESQCQKLVNDVAQLTKSIENLTEEKESMEKSWLVEKDEFETKLRQESEEKIQNLLEDEKLKYEEGQQQISDVKDRLEQVLQEAKLKLEEAEKKIDEEKDRADVALQEEKEKRMQSELKLSVTLEDLDTERSLAQKKHDDLAANILIKEKELHEKEAEISKFKQKTSEIELSYGNQLDAARKRSEKLEKDRELLKSRNQETVEEYERKMQALKDEIVSSQKQVEVLSKTAVEDNDVEVERKLESLKEDFERRLHDKEEEATCNIKRLMAEYETQIHQNSQAAEEKLEKLTQKNLAFQDSMRTDHHKELVFLQREIQSKEKQIEETEQKYETEMHEMEKKMSDQVDKAMYRAMVAEKKLQESDVEKENQELKSQLAEVEKALADTQTREKENMTLAQSLEARVSSSTPLADPDKLEYLRRILYSYIMDNEKKTMAKVLILLLQFNELEAQQILEKHGLVNK